MTAPPRRDAAPDVLVRRLFVALVGVAFFFAFLSLGAQIEGLIGANGILPAEPWLEAVANNLGGDRYWRVPTLFWIDASDRTLVGACVAGVVLSMVIATGRFERFALFAAWALYLSISTVGRNFLSYQWDILLLEVALVAIVLSPTRRATHPAAIWLGRVVLFKLMFSSGFVKLASGDATWSELRALMVHYETQPLPTVLGWYAHQLPAWFHRFSVIAVFVIQLVVPFGVFGPRRLRIAAGCTLIFLQVLIALTGNYCFFNLLAIALCLLAFDDRFLLGLVPRSWAALYVTRPRRRARFASAGAVVLLALNVVPFVDLLFGYGALPEALDETLMKLRATRSVNGYGLFAVMTTERREIVIEGSLDGREWRAYDLPAKPGPLDEPPPFVAPHQPRVDWQLWFAALGDLRQSSWLSVMLGRMLEGSPQVLELFENDPFEGTPPRWVRARLYRYRFTTWEERRATGQWWKREAMGMYAPPVTAR